MGKPEAVDYGALFSLCGLNALITGSTSGIGLAVARAMSAAGAEVAVSSEDAARCDEVAAALTREGAVAVALPCDVTSPTQLDALCSKAADRLGGIDILVCNAGGIAEGEQGLGVNSQGYRETLDLNLTQALRLTDRLAPQMAERGGGSIILMSSIAGLRGNRGIGAYALAKAAMAQLARNLAVQWGPANVRANSISPGLIRTPFASGMMGDDALMERRLSLTPLRRVGEPQEIAAAAVFLAAPGGGFITGQNLVIDGGTVISDGN